MNLHPYFDHIPQISSSVFMAEGAQIIGDVIIGEFSSVWYNAVLRGDLAAIRIGARSNIQDGVIGHVNTNQPLYIGNSVSVGHGAIVHGCSIADHSLIGMGAILLNGVELGESVLVGAGSLITEGTKIPEYTLVFGSPAKVIRELNESDIERMRRTTDHYVTKGIEFSISRRTHNREI